MADKAETEEELPPNEPEIVRIPSSQRQLSPHEPVELTKDALISLWIVYFSVFLDMTGMSIIQPILPFYAEEFGASAAQLGALYSSYSGMALLATLFMGKMSDKFGRKPMVMFSMFGTMAGYLLTGFAQSYGQLLACRFFTGAFGATAPVAQAYVTDVVPAKQRPKFLAAIGASISLAFVIGPGLGSGLGEFGIRVPFFVSSGLGAFGLTFALIMLRESHPLILEKRRRKKGDLKQQLNADAKHKEVDSVEMEVASDGNVESGGSATTSLPDQGSLADMDDIKVVNENSSKDKENSDEQSEKSGISVPAQIWFLCGVYFMSTLGWTVYTSMFALFVIDEYALDTLAVGYITLCLAFVIVFTNVIIFNLVAKSVGMYTQTMMACVIFAISSLLVPFILAEMWAVLFIVVFGFGVSFGQIMPAMTSMAAEYTNMKNRGFILSIVSMSGSAALIIGPLMMGALYGLDIRFPFWACAGCQSLGALVMVGMLIKYPKLRGVKKEKKDDDAVTEDVDPEDWVYVPDKVTRKDYMKLGKGLGTMLSQKNYLWVKYMPQLFNLLDTMFSELPIDSYQRHMAGINYIVENAKQTKEQYEALHLNNLVGTPGLR